MIPRSGRSLLALVGFACTVATATTAVADPLARVTLRWHAPAPCPDTSTLTTQLRLDLQGSQASEALDVDATVESFGTDEWLVRIRMTNAAGRSSRSLRARSCQALADATSLIVAMQLDPETAAAHARAIEDLGEPALDATPRVMNELPDAQPLRPATGATNQAIPLPLRTSNHVRPIVSETKTTQQKAPFTATAPIQPPVHWRGLASVSLMRDWGSLPLATGLLGGSLGVSRNEWLAEVALSTSLREPLTQSAGREIGSLAVVTGTLRVCRQVWKASSIALQPCAGVHAAWWSSEGNRNLTNQRSDTLTTASAEVGLVGVFSFSEALALIAPWDVVLPLNRPRFGFLEASERQVVVFEPSPVVLRVGLGFRLSFP